MSEFTKGPWVKDGLHVFGVGGEKVIVSDGPAFGSASHFKSAKANSHLIMAAPDMYDALWYCLDSLGSECALPADCVNQVKIALAKARGEL